MGLESTVYMIDLIVNEFPKNPLALPNVSPLLVGRNTVGAN